MWTACQCRGLSRSCGATPHTHTWFFQTFRNGLYQSIYPSIYSLNQTLTQLPTSFLFSFLTLKSPFVTTKAWPSIQVTPIYWHVVKQKIGWPIQIPSCKCSRKSILSALAKIPLPPNPVVTMTSCLHKSWLGRFYGSSSLHLNDKSPAAEIKSNILMGLKDSIVGEYRKIPVTVSFCRINFKCCPSLYGFN